MNPHTRPISYSRILYSQISLRGIPIQRRVGISEENKKYIFIVVNYHDFINQILSVDCTKLIAVEALRRYIPATRYGVLRTEVGVLRTPYIVELLRSTEYICIYSVFDLRTEYHTE